MSGPNIFFLLYFYERYKRKFYEKNGTETDKKPLNFFLWSLRFMGKILLAIAVFGSIGGIISLL